MNSTNNIPSVPLPAVFGRGLTKRRSWHYQLLFVAVLSGLILLCILWLRIPTPEGKHLQIGQLIQEAEYERALQKSFAYFLELGDSSMQAELVEPLYAQERVRDYYESGNPLMWIGPGGLNARGQILYERIRQADAVGLMPRDYHYSTLQKLVDSLGRRADGYTSIRAEFLLTDAFCLYQSHLHYGKLDSTATRPYWGIGGHAGQQLDPMVALNELYRGADLEAYLTSLEPGHVHYRYLKRATLRYLSLRDKMGDWPKVPAMKEIQPGDTHVYVPMVRARLQAEGLLASTKQDMPEWYETDLARAVAQFQQQHGLAPDSQLTQATQQAMNVPLEERIAQMRLNLERWRWVPADWGPNYLWVNIPEYKLIAYQAGEPVLEMRTIVGKKKRRTPFISSRLNEVVFNPYWTVPTALIYQDILPRAGYNPAFLAAMDMELVDASGQAIYLNYDNLWALSLGTSGLSIRQRPGAANSLGRMLFRFPNNWQVYLHDTPDKWAFDLPMRALSSGCVRLQQPEAVLDLLMSTVPDWQTAEKESLLGANGPRNHVRTIPGVFGIHLYYFTARADPEGQVYFLPDVYEIDPGRRQLLEQPYRQARQAGV
ncbi:MAG: murein L,D-transpeptidase [Sphingobacteriia bacterium]|jgi:murein L,D-transpeptidase YcbB/YkuD